MVPNLARVPFLIPKNNESMMEEKRVALVLKKAYALRREIMTRSEELTVLPDTNQTPGNVESTSELIDRLEAEMLRSSPLQQS
jgi:hypothetical protein